MSDGVLGAIGRWPVLRQLRERDVAGLGSTAYSRETEELGPRTRDADTVARSICPYCGVGCGQLLYAKDGQL
ncbi:MAG: hypothetical protein KY437_08910, partial [Actinobacteria bacterium]|nr:hypothetical protein [Actinomycetota bacterium]